MPASLTSRIAFALLALAAVTAGVWYGLREPEEPPAAATVSAALPAFRLVDHEGEPFTHARLEGRWTFLFFGYTYCPDICPMTLALMTAVHDRLTERPDASALPQIVFVTVDPERDTVTQMRDYVGYFNPAFIGVTGETNEIAILTGALRVPHRKVPNPESPGDYLVDHGSAIYLVDPSARLHAVMPAPHEVDAIAAAYLGALKHE